LNDQVVMNALSTAFKAVDNDVLKVSILDLKGQSHVGPKILAWPIFTALS